MPRTLRFKGDGPENGEAVPGVTGSRPRFPHGDEWTRVRGARSESSVGRRRPPFANVRSCSRPLQDLRESATLTISRGPYLGVRRTPHTCKAMLRRPFVLARSATSCVARVGSVRRSGCRTHSTCMRTLSPAGAGEDHRAREELRTWTSGVRRGLRRLCLDRPREQQAPSYGDRRPDPQMCGVRRGTRQDVRWPTRPHARARTNRRPDPVRPSTAIPPAGLPSGTNTAITSSAAPAESRTTTNVDRPRRQHSSKSQGSAMRRPHADAHRRPAIWPQTRDREHELAWLAAQTTLAERDRSAAGRQVSRRSVNTPQRGRRRSGSRSRALSGTDPTRTA